MSALKITVIGGTVRAVYTDDLLPLFDDLCGDAFSMRRASHVEPHGRSWIADMEPVDGPRLGPFTRRSEALQAERDWLDRNVA